MIIVRLSGGMGNQMFQYALGRSLALKNNVPLGLDTTFLLDRTPIPNFTFRDYNLNGFTIEASIVSRKDIPFIYRKYNLGWAMRYIDYARRKLLPAVGKEKKIYSFDAAILNSGPNTYLEGWWQSYKYFSNIEDIIRQDFTLKGNLSTKADSILEKIKNCESVSIHIRRGDYVSNKNTNRILGLCSFDYYREAIDLIFLKTKKPTFFVFSDDIDWCKNNIKINGTIIFVNELKNYEDLVLMSSCKHNIIANSSFSWWGGWLNANKNKIVVAPQNWYNDKAFNSNDLIPDRWIKI